MSKADGRDVEDWAQSCIGGRRLESVMYYGRLLVRGEAGP